MFLPQREMLVIVSLECKHVLCEIFITIYPWSVSHPAGYVVCEIFTHGQCPILLGMLCVRYLPMVSVPSVPSWRRLSQWEETESAVCPLVHDQDLTLTTTGGLSTPQSTRTGDLRQTSVDRTDGSLSQLLVPHQTPFQFSEISYGQMRLWELEKYLP